MLNQDNLHSIPLSAFPCFQTHDFNVWSQFMEERGSFSNYKFVSKKDFFACVNNVRLGDMTLSCVCNRSIYKHTYKYRDDLGHVSLLLSGNSIASDGKEKYHSKDYPLRVSRPSNTLYKVESEFPIVIFIFYPTASLGRLFSTMFGQQRGKVITEGRPKLASQVKYLSQLITNTINIFDTCPEILNQPHIISQYEQLIYTSLLINCPHNFSRFINDNSPAATPKIVRIVEEYIEANINQPIRLDNLAAITGLNARTVQETFKKYRGYSPSQFLREQRLLKGRKILQESPPDISITSVALTCGFASHPHFSDSFKKRFGETPLETLKKSRY
jgi:AraC-like DNA-binding protein